MIDAVHEAPVENTALAVAPKRAMTLMRPIAAPKDILVAQEETRTLIQETLKEGRDYGKIKGIDKPTLLKPGAERVQMAFGCFVRYRIVEQEVDHNRKVEWRKKKRIYNNAHKDDKSYREEETTGESLGLYRYVVEAQIVHRESGQIVGECIGVCSTMESKYVDRPRECENTALKMAEKRAHVGAVLNAFGLSEQFTQDIEDNQSAAATHDSEPAYEGALTRDSEITWGKYSGTKVRDLPSAYIKWGSENGRKFGPRTDEWQKVIRAELDAREVEKDQKRADTAQPQEPKAEPELATAAVGGADEEDLPF
jgi:hypothetical protein